MYYSGTPGGPPKAHRPDLVLASAAIMMTYEELRRDMSGPTQRFQALVKSRHKKPLKVIVAGCRDLLDSRVDKLVAEAIAYCGWAGEIEEIVSGKAPGVDAAGERWARKFRLSVKQFYASWLAEGKAAGPIRNRKMALYADRLIAVWDGKSPGTRSMIQIMKALGKPVYIHRFQR